MKKPHVVIIGAGLSGLAAALTLHRQGVAVRVLESQSEVGGRVRTRAVGNYLFDEGFQVLLTSYPELSRFLDMARLDLQKFNSGAMIFNGQKFDLLANPLLHPEHVLSSFGSEFISGADRALVLKLLAQSHFVTSDQPLGDKTTEQFLREFGFSESFIENFWRPFFCGVFLDHDLKVGHRFFQFLIRCFSTGRVAVPRLGMQSIPRMMAEQLPLGSVQLNSPVADVQSRRVRLQDGLAMDADAVISSGFLDGHNQSWNSVTTYYFTSPQLDQTSWDKWLLLVPKKFGFSFDHFCNIGAVNKTYGQGQPLLSVSVVGTADVSIDRIKSEMNQLTGQDLQLQHLHTSKVLKALPAATEREEGFHFQDGIYYCGDRWSSPSINGALKSGRKAAEKLLSDLGV